MGIPEKDFWHMTMRQLHSYEKAQQIIERKADESAWNAGRYTMLAVMTALDIGFNGKKAKQKYPEKPFLMPDEDENLTQEEYEEKVMREQIAFMEADMAREKLLGLPEI